MPSSNQTAVEWLNQATTQLNRYVPIIIYLFGTIGNLLNIIVLSQRAFRSNSCAFLFLMSSIASLIAIQSGLTNRVLASWIVDAANIVTWLCRCRSFLVFFSRMMALWLIALATIDRWLLSSMNVQRRRLSTLKNAQRSTLLVCILSLALNAPIFYCYQANLTNTPQPCYSRTLPCRIYTDMAYGCGSILIPALLMMCFSSMIIVNVRRTRRRLDVLSKSTMVSSITAVRMQRTKKKDNRLLLMLLVQVLCIVLLTFPQAIQKLYSTMTLNSARTWKSPVQAAAEDFLFNVSILLTYLASGLPFYIYTLSGGNVFRDECWRLLHSIGQQLSVRNVRHRTGEVERNDCIFH